MRQMGKQDERKVRLTARLRKETTMSLSECYPAQTGYIAERLRS